LQPFPQARRGSLKVAAHQKDAQNRFWKIADARLVHD
jgi:hypothetical protein